MSKSDPATKQTVVKQRPTIHEVARRSGLSVGTVSRILNGGNKATWASTAAREAKVKQIAAEIGYRPNYRAHSLRSQRSHTIGLVYGQKVPMLEGAYESIARAVVDVLGTRGYQMLFVPLPHDEPEAWPSDVLDRDRLDGCIGMDPLPDSVVELVRSRGLPIVGINVAADVPKVLPDDVAGAKAAVEHLVGLGHTRIAFMHEAFEDGGHFSLAIRRKTFLAEMKKRGLSKTASVFSGTPQAFVQDWLSKPVPERPTAVIVFYGKSALPLQHVLWASGVKVPQQLSVLCFDDLPAMQWLTPAMTTLNVPIGEIGRRAAELILAHVADGSALPTEPQYISATLIVRGSTTQLAK